ncbi:MFS transporter [Chromobacterium sp. IIBBL 290-4]|uniref:MFS transporter n=1 Tax=Chromobacterium sp. IIBBL 290-4 TaxID=2953890 RepID=UPI0020B7F2F4|nr:MFS transporter [Chromobacterium sp. IIBBL 290-4]UTH76524.1 MFS transporter [Chromobacterium sp. IIBBL 290-4]
MPMIRLRLFLAGRFASTLGDQLLLFAIPLIVFRTTGSAAMSGLAFLCEWLPRVLSLPVAGALSDKMGGRRVYLFADGIRAAACLLAALTLAAWPERSFALCAMLMAVCAACYAQAFIALESTIPRLVSPERMPKAQSLLQAMDYSSSLLGPALAGSLALWLPISRLPIIAALAFGLSALAALATPGAAANVASPGKPYQLRQGFGLLRTARPLQALVALSMLVNLIIGLALSTGAALTIGAFGQGDQTYAGLQTGMGALSIASFLLIPWLLKKANVYQLGIAAFALIVCGGLLMGAARQFWLFAMGYALSFGLCGLFNVFIRTERLHWIERDQLGRAISVIVLLNQLSLPLAGLLVAALGNRIAPQMLFYAAALLAGALGLPLSAYLRPRAITARATPA